MSNQSEMEYCKINPIIKWSEIIVTGVSLENHYYSTLTQSDPQGLQLLWIIELNQTLINNQVIAVSHQFDIHWVQLCCQMLLSLWSSFGLEVVQSAHAQKVLRASSLFHIFSMGMLDTLGGFLIRRYEPPKTVTVAQNSKLLLIIWGKSIIWISL